MGDSESCQDTTQIALAYLVLDTTVLVLVAYRPPWPPISHAPWPGRKLHGSV